MKTSLIIDLAGNLQSRSRQYAQALTGLSETGRRSFAALRSSAVSLGRGIDAVSNRYTAAIAGMGATWKATQAVMHSASLDKQLARITRTAGVSHAAGESLRRELYALSEQTGQSVDELLQGFSSLVQSGQSYDEALATTRALAPAMAVTGASAETLSSAMTVAAQNFKFDLSDVKMAKLLLDQMTKAGDLGNAELEHLADIFARVGGNARNAGLSMTDTLALIEQMSLVEKQPERLATLVDSTLRLWNNENYRKQAEKVTGVKFFDEKGNRRNAFDILAEMSAKYGKFTTDEMRSKGLFAAFGKTDLDTQRGIAMMLQQGIPAAARDMAGEIQRSGGLIEKALPDAIANSVDQVARLKATLGDAADSFARPVNDAIEKGIKFILDEQGIGGKELLVGGTAAALGGAGLLKLAGGLMARAGGGALASAAGKLGGGFGRLPLPLPVYVVNNRMSLTNNALSDMVNGKPTGVQGNVKTPGLPGNTMTGKARAGAKAGATAAKVAAPLAIPFQAWYSVSKAAVNAYTLALFNEVKQFGVSVCAVMPGDIRTGFTKARQKSHAGDDVYKGRIARSVAKMEKDEENGMPPEVAGRFLARVALKKRVKPYYAIGLSYKFFVLLSRILPIRLIGWLLGLLYAGE